MAHIDHPIIAVSAFASPIPIVGYLIDVAAVIIALISGADFGLQEDALSVIVFCIRPDRHLKVLIAIAYFHHRGDDKVERGGGRRINQMVFGHHIPGVLSGLQAIDSVAVGRLVFTHQSSIDIHIIAACIGAVLGQNPLQSLTIYY